jgi:hypothetical protein
MALWGQDPDWSWKGERNHSSHCPFAVVDTTKDLGSLVTTYVVKCRMQVAKQLNTVEAWLELQTPHSP